MVFFSRSRVSIPPVSLPRRAAILAIALLVSATLGAQQADRAQTEALAQRAAERLAALHAEADALAAQERTLLGELRRLELEREIRAEELARIERDTAAVSSELAALDAQVSALDAQAKADEPRLRARLVSLYKLGQGRYLRLLFSTSDPRQLAQAARTVAAMAGQDRAQIDEHQRRMAALTTSRAALEEQRSRLATLRRDTLRARESANAAVAARNALIADIDRRRDLNAQLAGELQTAQQRLQSTLATLTAGGAAAAPSLPLAPFRGDLDWPVSGTVRQAFGASRSGIVTNGIDIAAGEGADVHAIHEGTVAFAGPFAGYGRLVIIDHGAQTFSLYGNLRDEAVTQGRPVSRGDVVGTVGVAATGAAGLYFELRVDGRAVDPLQWLRNP
jgi:septal ring factor EnvC (AmiA/AmiB activator)